MLPSDLKLLIRADASPQIGTGPVARCLSLANAWKALGGQVAFACGDFPEMLRQRIVNQGFLVHSIAHSNGNGADARATGEVAKAFEPDWIVLGGEQFDDTYRSKLRNVAAKLMVIDDNGSAAKSEADLIVRPFGSGCHGDTGCPNSTPQILSGVDFFLARDGTMKSSVATGEKHIVANARRILVAMGKADANDVSRCIVESLGQLKRTNLVVDVVVAPDYPYSEELWKIKKETGLNLRCHRKFDRAWGLTDRIDLAIAHAGIDCLELARQGCPAILFSTSENQIPLAAELDRLGAAIDAGSATDFASGPFVTLVDSVSRNADLRRQMSNRGSQVIDVHGAARIARRLAAQLFTLRPANISDANTLHRWRNEPEYRALSFSPQPISLASHLTWLERRLKSADSIIWIVHDKSGASIGTIAVDSVKSEAANLAICLCPTQRGKGLGTLLIEKASLQILQEHAVDRILVQFKHGNNASQNAFKKAGYRPIAPTTVNGFTALQMAFERSSQVFSGQSTSPLRKSA